MAWVVPAQAATLTLGLDVEFSGGTPPTGTAPWITATFDDSFGDANTVRLTLTANNLVDTETVGQWYFNFDPVLDPTLLSIVVVDESSVGPVVIDTGVNQFQADGDGLFDISFDFPPPPGKPADRFRAGETVVYDLVYVSPIVASSFEYSSEQGGGAGSFLTAAQILSIGSAGESGWIGVVPEPGTAALFGLGLLAMGAARRRTPRH